MELKKTGWYILSILSLIPLLLWLFEQPINLRFSNLSAFSRGMGDVLGLCGMAMFSLVMILSARLKIFEKFFNGINESYTAHHFFGALSFCLLLFHPLFLAYNYLLVSPTDAALFLLPGTSIALDFGIFGLLIMIATLVITFYTKLKYQIWKFTHKFLGIAFILAFLHTFMVGGDISTNSVLKIYLFILGAIAIATYFYRTALPRFFVKTFEYTVKETKQLPDKIWEIEFQPDGKEIKFVAGQFAFLKIKSSNLSREFHPFSFSSAPGMPLKIAVKELGDYTNKIMDIKVGDLVTFEGPFGKFNFKNYSKNQVWIAGGIGITPFLSMLRGSTGKDSEYKIDLYYSIKDENCSAFVDELKQIADINKNLRLFVWISKRDGFINAKSINDKTSDLVNKDILICGPPVMMSSLKTQFLEININKSKIHAEEFQLY